MTDVEVRLRRLHPAQLRMEAEARRFNVAMCGRRTGKTAYGTDKVINRVLDGQSWGWFAPTYKLLEEAWREMRAVLGPVPGIRSNAQQMRIEVPNGGVIEGWSLEGGDDVARGRRYHGIVVDEAGLVAELLRIWHAAIRPTLADYRGEGWFLGTPKGVGDFSALYAWGQSPAKPEWASWRLSTHENPYIQPAEIEAMRLEMPDAIYRQEVLGEPIDDAEHPIGLQAINACIAPLSTAKPVVYGVDLARSIDYTVALGIDSDGYVSRFERWQSPWNITRERLKAILGKGKDAVWARADSTGVGDPIVEDLQRDGCTVESVTLTAKSKQNAVERLIVAIQQQLIHFPDGIIAAELRTLTAERTPYGIRYQALEGRHDDAVIALAFAVDGWTNLGYRAQKQAQPKAYSQDKTRADWTTGREPKGILEVEPGEVQNAHPWKVPRRTRQSFIESL